MIKVGHLSIDALVVFNEALGQIHVGKWRLMAKDKLRRRRVRRDECGGADDGHTVEREALRGGADYGKE